MSLEASCVLLPDDDRENTPPGRGLSEHAKRGKTEATDLNHCLRIPEGPAAIIDKA